MTRSCPTCATSYPDESFFCGADGSITVQDQDGAKFDPRLGKQLGGYIVAARVADGAMGRVYEGRHPETKARVAVKVLHEHVARDRVAVERFKREYEAAKEMDSPFIVHVLEFGETPDRSYFMTMEYLQGQELSKAITPKHPLPLPRIVRTICQLAAALEHAHSYGFIHRDLKPDNVFLCETPTGTQVRVLDFGSVKLQMETGAKLTALGTTLGSPYYMSPEQATGATDVDQRSDVFAMGAILWELLTGRVAFEAPSVALILMKILNQQPPAPSGLNPECTPAIDAVVEKALRKDKAARYDSARKLAEQLLQACGLSTDVETWAQKPEADLAAALVEGAARAKTDPAAAAAPSGAAAAPASGPAPALRGGGGGPSPALRGGEAGGAPSSSPAPSSFESPRSSGRAARVSDEPLTVPSNAPKTKWIVSIAIGVAVLCLLAFLMR